MKKGIVALAVFSLFTPAALLAAGVRAVPLLDTVAPSVILSLDNGGGCVVAGEIVIEYDADLFALSSIDRGMSVFTLWLPDATSTGHVVLAGGTPGGFCGSFSGEGIVTSIASLSFIPLTADTALAGHIRIGTSSALYDGAGLRVDTSAAR